MSLEKDKVSYSDHEDICVNERNDETIVANVNSRHIEAREVQVSGGNCVSPIFSNTKSILVTPTAPVTLKINNL